MKMKKQNALVAIMEFEKRLPYGAKAIIARKIRQNRHNVQTVFRGMAGEKLTIKVYNKAKELFPIETKPVIKKRRFINSLSKL